jgi:hypothetical protein
MRTIGFLRQENETQIADRQRRTASIAPYQRDKIDRIKKDTGAH